MHTISFVLAASICALALAVPQPSSSRAATAPVTAAGDWPQLGRDAQRTNASLQQVNAPYCYAWKWYEVPMASRAQPVVVDGRLFIGDMDGVVHARDATTGAPVWMFATGGPIRHSAGVAGRNVIVSSHDGTTYALDAATGALRWKAATGASATAPLIDDARGWAYVASTDGTLTALDVASGAQKWSFNASAPILTSPSLSADGKRVFLGTEAIEAIGVEAGTGKLIWRAPLQGQSLADRYPVVAGDIVMFRSQPLHYFHVLLQEGDQIMDSAGAVQADWAADWSKVKPKIVDYLTQAPTKQTFFALDGTTGKPRGVAPVLYTTGNNDPPNVPVVRGQDVFVAYRARHGIQTDGGAVHVSSAYDADLGRMNPATLDIAGIGQASAKQFAAQFRMTSDESGFLTMGGDTIWVDNWERLGGFDTKTGQLLHVGNVSNVWPECYGGDTCGPDGPDPFFPLSGSGQAYPFPSPRVTEGAQRGGVVVANNMLYWRVIEGGLAGIKSGTCGVPKVWAAQAKPAPAAATPRASAPATRAQLETYVSTDRTSPVTNPPAELVARLRTEVQALLRKADGKHLLPIYVNRGFTRTTLWPYNSDNCGDAPDCVASAAYIGHGNVFWHDPGELLLMMAQAYPYLDAPLQAQVRDYMQAEMQRYPPLASLKYGSPWMTEGVAREPYAVPFRNEINNWPPVGANLGAVYAAWLWTKNTGNWAWACSQWPQANALFGARRSSIRYYADVAGLIGYARLAKALHDQKCEGVRESDYTAGLKAATDALATGQGAKGFEEYAKRADKDYLDPRDIMTGFSAPALFGMTPEIGAFLRERTDGAAARYLQSKQTGDGVRWWFLTRGGIQAEEGETSFMLPITAWSHFLARAYVMADARAALTKWLDRPWTVGDPYSIQKIVATIQAK